MTTNTQNTRAIELVKIANLAWMLIPTSYLYEVTPPGKATANERLIRHANGRCSIEPAWEIDVTAPIEFLSHGDEIKFDRLADVSEQTITVQQDGTWSLSGALPTTDEGVSLYAWIPYQEARAAEPEISVIAEPLLEESDEFPAEADIRFFAWHPDTLTLVFDGTNLVERMNA